MPDVSVIVSTHNQNDSLNNTLPLWLKMADEVIVVDNGSDSKAETIVKDHGATYLYQLDEGVRQAAAFQNGLNAASGLFIQFTDAESIPDEGHLTACVDTWEPGIMCLGPRRFREKNSWVEDERVWDRDAYYNYKNVCGGNMFMEREALKSIGGWNTEYIGYWLLDWDVGIRWVTSGRRFRYVPNALVSYFSPRTHPEISDNIKELFKRTLCDLGYSLSTPNTAQLATNVS